jgi:hypothetical protein
MMGTTEQDGVSGREGTCGPARLLGRMGLVLALLISAAACGSSGSTSTTPTVATTTDTFTGTVAVGGQDFHSFTITTTGTIGVTLTATTPSSIVMGLNVGIPANGLCPAMAGASIQTAAGASVQLSGVASPGLLCVDVQDVGNQSAPVSYTVTVNHP